MSIFLTPVTEISKPRLHCQYQAPITARSLKIYSDGAGKLFCCLDNAAYVLDVGFNNKLCGGVPDKKIFESAVAEADVEIFYCREHNLYYCKLKDLPTILRKAIKNFRPAYQEKAVDIENFCYWFQDKIFLKIFNNNGVIFKIFQKYFEREGYTVFASKESKLVDFLLGTPTYDQWAKFEIFSKEYFINGIQRGFTLKNSKLKELQKFADNENYPLFLYFADLNTGKVYRCNFKTLMTEENTDGINYPVYLPAIDKYAFAFELFPVFFELTEQEVNFIRAELNTPENAVKQIKASLPKPMENPSELEEIFVKLIKYVNYYSMTAKEELSDEMYRAEILDMFKEKINATARHYVKLLGGDSH